MPLIPSQGNQEPLHQDFHDFFPELLKIAKQALFGDLCSLSTLLVVRYQKDPDFKTLTSPIKIKIFYFNRSIVPCRQNNLYHRNRTFTVRRPWRPSYRARPRPVSYPTLPEMHSDFTLRYKSSQQCGSLTCCERQFFIREVPVVSFKRSSDNYRLNGYKIKDN